MSIIRKDLVFYIGAFLFALGLIGGSLMLALPQHSDGQSALVAAPEWASTAGGASAFPACASSGGGFATYAYACYGNSVGVVITLHFTSPCNQDYQAGITVIGGHDYFVGPKGINTSTCTATLGPVVVPWMGPGGNYDWRGYLEYCSGEVPGPGGCPQDIDGQPTRKVADISGSFTMARLSCPLKYNLTTTNLGNGSGEVHRVNVTPSDYNCTLGPNGSGSESCSGKYTPNTIVRLEAVPSPGSTMSVLPWAGCQYTAGANNEFCEVTMGSADKNLSVRFLATTSPPTLTFTADDVNPPFNTGTTLRWTPGGNVTSCTASGDWSGAKSTSPGSEGTGNLTVSKTYVLQCSGPGGGSPLRSVTVTPGGVPLPDITTTNDPANSTTFVDGDDITLQGTSHIADAGTPAGTDWYGDIAVMWNQSDCSSLPTDSSSGLTKASVDYWTNAGGAFQNVPAGETRALSAIIPSSVSGYQVGNHCYAFVSDWDNFVTESDETNNASPWLAFTITDAPVDGQCGGAATNYAYDDTGFSGAFCSAGIPNPASPAFPAQGGSTNWVCDGINGGNTSGQCTATRSVAPPVSQCSNGVDDADPEDTLVDAADPGCHTDGNASNPGSYDPNDNNETDTPTAPPVLTTSKTFAKYDEPFRLTWDTNNGDETHCAITGPGLPNPPDDVALDPLTHGSGDVDSLDDETGIEEINMKGTATYTLTCYELPGANGAQVGPSASVEVQLIPGIWEE